MNTQTAIQEYRKVGVESAIVSASAYEHVALLLGGLITALVSAKLAISRSDVASKGEQVSRALDIVDNLRASLDFERGGQLAERLWSIYEYAEVRMLEANIASDSEKLDEVINLFSEIQAGWSAIENDVENV